MGCFDSASSESQSESKTAGQKKTLQEMLDLYGPTLGQGADIFPGSRVTPFSTLQEGAVSGAGNFTDFFSEPQQAGTPLAKETGAATKGLLAGETGAKPIGAQGVEDYFKGAIYDPTMKTLREDTIPGIAESFAGPGFFGSARSQEESKAFKDVGANLSTQRAGLEWDVLSRNQQIDESKAGRTLATLPSAMAFGQVPAQEIKNNLEIAASQLGGLGQVFGFGKAEQTQAQTELQDEIMRFAEENQITDPENLSILLTLLGMNFSRSSSSGSGAGLGYSALGSAAQGAGQGAGAAAMSAFIASDVRVKENIKTFDNALEIVRKLKPMTYNYIGQKRKRMGLIAQDIEKVLPEAVIEIDGIKHVDLYAMQTLIISALNELLGDK